MREKGEGDSVCKKFLPQGMFFALKSEERVNVPNIFFCTDILLLTWVVMGKITRNKIDKRQHIIYAKILHGSYFTVYGIHHTTYQFSSQ